jgi:ADP-ribose pyrophosphatase YjhB (NUDIX family)
MTMESSTLVQRAIKLAASFPLAIARVLEQGDEAMMDALREFAAGFLNLVPSDKPMKTALFDAHARLGINDALECACVRRNGETGQVEVYLVRRAADDSAFPGQWHMPGTFFRRGEQPVDVARRLTNKELYGRPFVDYGYFVVKFFPNEEDLGKERGHINSELWLFPSEANLPTTEDRGWFEISSLPEPTVYSHRDKMIPAAIAAYERWEKGGPAAVPKLQTIKPQREGG